MEINLISDTVTKPSEEMIKFMSSISDFELIIKDEVNFNKDDVKLIDEKARKVISDFNSQFEKIDISSREILESIVNKLIKSHDTNFKGVGQPLRIALTGSKFGPGIYDIILSLGKEEVQKRLSAKIA